MGILGGNEPGRLPKVTVVLPAHNEAGNLKRAIKETEDFLFKICQDFEIIIAEDGSTDGTDDIAKGIANSNHRVRWMHHDERLGRGRALSDAFRESEGSILVYMDVDLSTDIRFLEPLIGAIIEGYDVATGSRAHPLSIVHRSLKRTITSLVYNSLVKLLLGSKIRDHQCGFKAFNRESLFKLLDKARTKHWFWDTEILVLAELMRLKIKEIPIIWRAGEKTKVNLLKDFFEMGNQLLRLYWRINVNRTVQVYWRGSHKQGRKS